MSFPRVRLSHLLLLVLVGFVVGLFLLIEPPAPVDEASETEATAVVSTPAHAEGEPAGAPDLLIRPFNRVFHSGGRKVWEILAREARAFRDEERFALTGITSAMYVDRQGRTFRLTADEGLWDRRRMRFTVRGHVRVEIDPGDGSGVIRVESEDLTLDRGMNRVSCVAPVRIVRDDVELRGESLNIDLTFEEMTLAPGVTATIRRLAGRGEEPARELPEPLVIRAGRMHYSDATGIIEFTEDPWMEYGPHTLHAVRIRYLAGENDALFAATGRVRLRLRPAPDAPAEGPLSRGPILVTSAELTASPRSRTISLRGGVEAVQAGDSFSCERLDILLDDESDTVIGALAWDDVRFEHGEWRGEARRGIYTARDHTVRLRGRARVRRGRDWIRATLIQYGLESGEILCTGEVEAEVRRVAPAGRAGGGAAQEAGGEQGASGSAGRAGLFGRGGAEGPIRCRAASLRYSPEEESALLQGDVEVVQGADILTAPTVQLFFRGDPPELAYILLPAGFQLTRGDQLLRAEQGGYYMLVDRFRARGDARLWQGEDFTRADEMVFFPGAGRGYATGSVDTFISARETPPEGSAVPEAASGEEAEGRELRYHPTLVHAQRLEFDETTGRAVFTGAVRCEQGGMKLRAEKVEVWIDPTTRSMERLTAEQDVEIDYGEARASGDTMEYDVAAQTIVLSCAEEDGCRVVRGNRSTRGRRILLDLPARRYVVEGGESLFIPDFRGRETGDDDRSGASGDDDTRDGGEEPAS
jgi:lipopolysaccharide transport protein LptA/LPS export ABC transporter protein LptC